MATSRSQRRVTRPLSVIGIVALVIALHYVRILQPLETVVIRAIQPVQTRLYSIVNRPPEGQKSYDQLQEELIQVQQEVEELRVANSQLKIVANQTSLLEEQMQFLEEQSYRAISAKVASRSTDDTAHTIILNRGSNDGIAVGAPVIIGNGVLIGTIDAVDEETSAVLLMTSFRSRISATIQNEQSSPGIIQGEHNISIEMDFIPQPDVVSVGDTVVSSGSDERIPSGLAIGTVEAVYNEPGSLFQQAAVDPLFDVTRVSIVSVLQP